jgi:DoxX
LLAPAATQAMLRSHHLPMVKYGWMLAVAVELGGGLAILFGLFTRPVGLVLAIWCVATALIAHTNFADRNQEIHFLKNMAMMGRVSLRRGVRRRRLESRRTVVAPWSVAVAGPSQARFYERAKLELQWRVLCEPHSSSVKNNDPSLVEPITLP